MWNILYMQRNFIFFISIFLFLSFFFAGLLEKWDIVRKTAWEHCYGCVWMHGHTRTNMKDWNVRPHRKLQVVRFLTNRQCWWCSSHWSSAVAAKVSGDFFFSFLHPNEEHEKNSCAAYSTGERALKRNGSNTWEERKDVPLVNDGMGTSWRRLTQAY